MNVTQLQLALRTLSFSSDKSCERLQPSGDAGLRWLELPSKALGRVIQLERILYNIPTMTPTSMLTAAQPSLRGTEDRKTLTGTIRECHH